MRELKISEFSLERNTTKSSAAKRPKNILEAFEQIVELAEDSKLDDKFFEAATPYIKYAERKLKLTSMQSVLLSLFVDRSEQSRILMSELAEYTGCRTTRMLRFAQDIDRLESLHYLRASRGRDSLSYRVPMTVIDALRRNEPYVHKEDPIGGTAEFFDRLATLFSEKEEGEITFSQLGNTICEALAQIKDTAFATALRHFHLDTDNTTLFLYMAHLFIANDDDNIGFGDIEDVYDERKIPYWVKRELRSHDSVLFFHNLIENVNEDGMARSDRYKLTNYAKDELLAELNLNNVAKSDKGLIKHTTLAAKNMVYNATERAQIAELSSILSKDRFAEVQKRLRSAGMRPGFCCLFYGAPGTGKTETVYQLARLTGRDIMQVDVDKIKSCWVGESEKNIKSLFNRYRNLCKDTDLAPILLFNEADAVLGVRMEGASNAVDKMENSIQNIILQEMETIEGIMIATTNLTSNLDIAFERRFLYKVRYEKPTAEARSQIWQAMLPALSADDATELSKRFDLSGGEIENIVRKHSVNAILSGSDTADVNAIAELCALERIGSSRSRIGF